MKIRQKEFRYLGGRGPASKFDSKERILHKLTAGQIPENVEDKKMRTIERGRWGRSSRSPSNIKSNFLSTSRSKPVLDAEAEKKKKGEEMHQHIYYKQDKKYTHNIEV